MRLIKQYNIANAQLPFIRLRSSAMPSNQFRVEGLNTVMNAVRELQILPSLEKAATSVLTALPISTDEAIILSESVYTPLRIRLDLLNSYTSQLINLLKPLITQEEESTLYIQIPRLDRLSELNKFTSNLTKNLDQIFVEKISIQYSLGFRGVEKGSDWLILLLFANGTAANIDQIKTFISFIFSCVEFYEKFESLKKLFDQIKSLGKPPKEQQDLENQQKNITAALQENERKNLVDKILEIAPLSENQNISNEDYVRIGNAAYNIGKTFSTETTIEISGLIEERVGAETTTRIETLKVTKKKKMELIPTKNPLDDN